jgi:putative transposase
MPDDRMARPARLEIPGVPLHIVQRGVNRGACFFNDVDRRYYLKLLGKFAARRNCVVHAYVLMTNHVHLLVTPGVTGAAAALLQDLGRSYVRVINSIHGRTGTLWEGRFKSCLVVSESYFLTCQRYIELNPVRAGMAQCAEDYPWSSHRHHALGDPDRVVSAHDCYLRLGDDASQRCSAYRALFDCSVDSDTLQRIRVAVNTGTALGSGDFIARIGASVGRTVGAPIRGRPPKESSVSGKLL